MIGQHPELYGLPELNLFQCETVGEFNSGIGRDGRSKSPYWPTMRHGLLRALAELYAGEQTVETVAMAERLLRAREEMRASDLFHQICAKIAPLRAVEKSPGVLRQLVYMERMRDAFPRARFIHLVRNPLGQCNSMLKAKGGIGVLLALASVDRRGDTAEIEPQIMWHDTQVQILRFLDTVPDEQVLTIQGEVFLSDLDRSLPELCRWLDISDAPEALAAMRRPETSPYSCVGPANARLGNDVNFLNAPGLREGNVKNPALDTALPWRKDGDGFHPRVVALAGALGYDGAAEGFAPRRAPVHRTSLGPDFATTSIVDGGKGLSVAQIMADKKLSTLAVAVWDELRVQFSTENANPVEEATAAEALYRQRLEGFAELLETLLEETLDELERLDGKAPDLGQALG